MSRHPIKGICCTHLSVESCGICMQMIMERRERRLALSNAFLVAMRQAFTAQAAYPIPFTQYHCCCHQQRTGIPSALGLGGVFGGLR